MSGPAPEMIELFLQEASEHLQFLREYSGILQDAYLLTEDVERLYFSAHGVATAGGTYGFPLFQDVAGKLAHIFQYAMKATIGPEATAPLVEFIYEAIAVLESDLIMIDAKGVEAAEDMAAFRLRYPFAFGGTEAQTPDAQTCSEAPPQEAGARGETPATAETDARALTPSVVPTPVESAAMAPEVPELATDEAIPGEVLEFFVPEAEEHLQAIADCLMALEANPNQEEIHRLLRGLHNLKGAAAQVGWQRIATISHCAEDLVERLRAGELKPGSGIIDLCLETVDVLNKLVHRQWEDEAGFQLAARLLMAKLRRVPSAEPEARADGELESAPREATPAESGEQQTEAAAAAAPVAETQSKSVRIGLERLDRMLNAVGELVINRTRLLGRVVELQKLAEVLNFSKGRMNEKVRDFQEKYEFIRIGSSPANRPQWPFAPAAGGGNLSVGPVDAEFGELELDRYDDFGILSRSLTEISADISEVLSQLDGFVRRVDGDADEFTRLAQRLQDEITQVRMVPIGNLFTRIARTVRDAAKASEKQVELTLEGAETELDNNIVQQLADPLLHLVRNAVAHGIEQPQERYEGGKPDQGNIAVRAFHRGNHIFVVVEDDGRGVDFEQVKAVAVECGFVSAGQVEGMERREVLKLLFHPGFSTSPQRSELAGRGVGLDVVRANVASLNGEIEIDTEKGVGTRFTLRFPLTLMISPALFVRCGEQSFAFPLSAVEEILRIRPEQIEQTDGRLVVRVRETPTEVVRLDDALQLPRLQAVNGYLHLVLVNAGGRAVGVVVEEVLRKDEIVIKNLGEYLRNVKLFPGATIAPDGSLILLVDVYRLLMGEALERRPATQPGAAAMSRGEVPAAAVDEVTEQKVVVLADDSISVRKFVGRMLTQAGYRVKLACDGLEALEIAASTHCDLVITDLEMPRINGYELMRHLRQTPSTGQVPVMVVTSRAGARHREGALEEGAAAFLVKPVQEETFIANVAALIGSSRKAPPDADSIERGFDADVAGEPSGGAVNER